MSTTVLSDLAPFPGHPLAPPYPPSSSRDPRRTPPVPPPSTSPLTPGTVVKRHRVSGDGPLPSRGEQEEDGGEEGRGRRPTRGRPYFDTSVTREGTRESPRKSNDEAILGGREERRTSRCTPARGPCRHDSRWAGEASGAKTPGSQNLWRDSRGDLTPRRGGDHTSPSRDRDTRLSRDTRRTSPVKMRRPRRPAPRPTPRPPPHPPRPDREDPHPTPPEE